MFSLLKPILELSSGEAVVKLNIKIFLVTALFLLVLNVIEMLARTIMCLTIGITITTLGLMYIRNENNERN